LSLPRLGCLGSAAAGRSGLGGDLSDGGAALASPVTVSRHRAIRPKPLDSIALSTASPKVSPVIGFSIRTGKSWRIIPSWRHSRPARLDPAFYSYPDDTDPVGWTFERLE